MPTGIRQAGTGYRAHADLRARVDELRDVAAAAAAGPGPAATSAQHDRGKRTARERLALLFDPGSFRELEQLRVHRSHAFGLAQRRPATDGVVVGWGDVHGQRVFAYAHDFRIFGGSLGEAHAEKIHKVMDLAESVGAPLVGLADGAGARIQEGVTALAGYGGIFRRNVRLSGVVPQISVVLGPCAGGASYSPALTDFVFMVEPIAQMYITGPDVVRAVTGEEITHQQLGGAGVHGHASGVAHVVHTDEAECLADVRHLLALLPPNNRTEPPATPVGGWPRRDEALLDIVPADPAKAYDMRRVVERLVDDGDLFEVQPQWARNIVCGLARLDGHPVGIVANQPAALAGVLDIHASEKAARFVSTCDAFNIPLVTLVDVPGFLPGRQQEHDGIIRHGAKLLYAYCNATVPRIQVILRKAYGGAYIVMDSRSIGSDLSLAWPINEIAVMGAEAAADVVFAREIAAAADPEATRREKIKQYAQELMHPYHAAERGLVDAVIDPAETRAALADGLAMLRTKSRPLPVRKHGNPPQ